MRPASELEKAPPRKAFGKTSLVVPTFPAHRCVKRAVAGLLLSGNHEEAELENSTHRIVYLDGVIPLLRQFLLFFMLSQLKDLSVVGFCACGVCGCA